MEEIQMDRDVVTTATNRIRRFAMKDSRSHIVLLFLVSLAMIAGCASTKMTSRERLVTGPLPRPGGIWIYDFVANPADVPANSELAGQFSEPATPPTQEQIEAGRALGDQIAAELVKRIREMGLPAAQASAQSRPGLNDLVIRGYLISIDEGSATKRIAIGFGSGSSNLKTVVEAFQVTPQGLRKLGSGTLDSGGSKGPGSTVPLAVAIATGNPVGLIVSGGVKIYGEASGSSRIEGRADQTAKEIANELEKRFKEQGWIR
jgi:hypothetical protein